MRSILSIFLVSVLVNAVTPGWAQAAGGVEFLDTRPIVIDVDRTLIGQRWRVPVVDGQSGQGHRLAIHVVFQPAGVIDVPDAAVRRGSQGDVIEFVIELRRRLEGSGELVIISGGNTARRQISTRHGATAGTVAVGSLQFTGVRLVPFTDQVRVGVLTIGDAPGRSARTTAQAAPRRIGVLTSTGGDVAEVIRRGDDFFVRGADNVGEYSGSVDLAPGEVGGDAQTTMRVRDLPAWPLFILLLGLIVVQALDRYQSRVRPRRLLELRLARLRDQARATERETAMALRICAMPGDPGLLLDKLVADALAASAQHTTDVERAAWEPDGASFQGLSGVVESFRRLADSFRGLRQELRAVETWTASADSVQVSAALADSVVGAASRGRAIGSAADLAQAAAQLDEAKAYLRDFRVIYRIVGQLRTSGATDLRDGAARILAQLYTAPDDLVGLKATAQDLFTRWQPEPTGWTRVPVPGATGTAPPYTTAPAAGRARSGRTLPMVVAAGVVLLTGILAFSWIIADRSGFAPPGSAQPTGVPTAGQAPSGVPTPPALPIAPVAAPPQAPPAIGFEARPISAGQVVWFGGVLPLLLAGLAGLVGWGGWLLARSRRGRQRPHGLGDLDTAAIDRQVRTENLRFRLVSGVLVGLSGMSLLYVGNPTFGSPGDYVAVALWGTAVGEGLQLVRRFLPFQPMP